MSDIMLPRPGNVRGRFGTFVESDMYHIAERLQELDERLYIQEYDTPVSFNGQTYRWVVVEVTPDGVEHFVFRPAALDARAVEHVRYLLHVPFEQRFAEAEKLEAKHEADCHQAAMDKLGEDMGEKMYYWLDRCGFSQRGESIAKVNRTAQRHRAFRNMPKEARPPDAR